MALEDLLSYKVGRTNPELGCEIRLLEQELESARGRLLALHQLADEFGPLPASIVRDYARPEQATPGQVHSLQRRRRWWRRWAT